MRHVFKVRGQIDYKKHGFVYKLKKGSIDGKGA